MLTVFWCCVVVFGTVQIVRGVFMWRKAVRAKRGTRYEDVFGTESKSNGDFYSGPYG